MPIYQHTYKGNQIPPINTYTAHSQQGNQIPPINTYTAHSQQGYQTKSHSLTHTLHILNKVTH